METKLAEAFSPERLEVVNESHLHAGHHHLEDGHDAVFDGSGETHFRVRIVAPAFAGMSRIQRHQAVNAALAGELKAACTRSPSSRRRPARRRAGRQSRSS
jgi:BolA protein